VVDTELLDVVAGASCAEGELAAAAGVDAGGVSSHCSSASTTLVQISWQLDFGMDIVAEVQAHYNH